MFGFLLQINYLDLFLCVERFNLHLAKKIYQNIVMPLISILNRLFLGAEYS